MKVVKFGNGSSLRQTNRHLHELFTYIHQAVSIRTGYAAHMNRDELEEDINAWNA
jgi:hypothetical protein